MLAGHPHGILLFGFFMNSYEHYNGALICASRMILSLPINGLFMRWCGGTPVRNYNNIIIISLKKFIYFIMVWFLN